MLGAAFLMAAVLWAVRPKPDTPAVLAPPVLQPRPAPTIVPDDPFAGSPAASYASGAAAITVPEAKAMGGFPADHVARLYLKTQRMVQAAGLDRKTLLGGAPDAFIATLDRRLRPKFHRSWVVSMAPGSAELVSNVIKVRGQMSARPATRERVKGLDVSVDYLFVCAIRKPGGSGPVKRLVVRLTGTTFHDSGKGERYWWIDQGVSSAPAACNPGDGFIHPEFGNSGPAPSGSPIDPYDQSGPPPAKCQATNRT